MATNTIVVCGGTGSQGRAVITSLLATNQWNVVAISRTPGGAPAQALERSGVRVVEGNLLDRGSLEAAFQGAYGVFGVTQPWSADHKSCDTAGEVQQGRNIVDAARDAGVGHLVLSTVLQIAQGRTGIPHVDSKLEVEEYALAQKVPLTLLRPGSFMDNIGQPFFPVKPGKVRGFTARDAKVPYVACADIGTMAAMAFARPQEFVGTAVDVVGDLVSGGEIAAILGRLRGQRFKYTAVPALAMRLFAPREFYLMRRAFENLGRPPLPPAYVKAVEGTRRLLPDATTMEKFLAGR